MPLVYPKPPAFPDINLKQLFNWPGVSFTITLEHIQIYHELKTNVERDIIIGQNNYINLDQTENILETRHLQHITSSKANQTVHKAMFNVYMSSMMEAARIYEIPPSKLSEIRASFSKILEDVATVPSDLIQTKLTHSQFLNKFKYTRIFDNYDDESAKNKKVKIRETINPESIFRIDRSSMLTERPDEWLDSVEMYFKDIFVRKYGIAVKNVKERFKKCLSMQCVPCNLPFEGAMSTVSMKDHIKEKHFVDKPWECVKCHKSWSEIELTQMDWKHECCDGDKIEAAN